jgi:L-rhamnose-H+ transport protein
MCNGLFTTPMKIILGWKWEHLWAVFISVSCLLIPTAVVLSTIGSPGPVLRRAPGVASTIAVSFGFAWGFGAILFGRSVERLGVSLANSLVIGVSSALGSLAPLLLKGVGRMAARHVFLLLGIASFIGGAALCGQAGRMREGRARRPGGWTGYWFAAGAGVMSAVFNIGYTKALPIAEVGAQLGYSHFAATNVIWLLMLAAGSAPNLAYCAFLVHKHRSLSVFTAFPVHRSWALSVAMGILWSGSILLYGAATPLLGSLGPSVGWPLCLAVALAVANAMGIWLREWNVASSSAVRRMKWGILTMLLAAVFCGMAAHAGK